MYVEPNAIYIAMFMIKWCLMCVVLIEAHDWYERRRL